MNNLQVPFFGTENFIPDQLIAGHLNLVTDSAILAAGVHPRGTVLGQKDSGEYVLSVKTATDGSQNPCAILIERADASAAPCHIGVYLMGEFNGRAITFDATWNLATVTTALRQYSVFIKGSVSAADPT